jgi:hypothetical protein
MAMLLAGCDAAGSGSAGPGSTTGTATLGSAGATPGSSPAGAGAGAEPTGEVSGFVVTYNFAVPTSPVTVNHPVAAPALPTLVGIYVGDHPTDSPAYQRMTFYFRGGFPSYQIGYVAAVLGEAQGTPIPLPGNAFLRVGFTDAQAHGATGGVSVIASPAASLGYSSLKGYAPAGDFEGHVTYGLGIQVAAGSDQARPIRVGELIRAGTGGPSYVVFVDVQAG